MVSSGTTSRAPATRYEPLSWWSGPWTSPSPLDISAAAWHIRRTRPSIFSGLISFHWPQEASSESFPVPPGAAPTQFNGQKQPPGGRFDELISAPELFKAKCASVMRCAHPYVRLKPDLLVQTYAVKNMEDSNSSEWKAAISELHRLLKEQESSHSEENNSAWMKKLPTISPKYCVLCVVP